MRFDVIDVTTNQYPNLKQIALSEEWAKELNHCDMEGFHIDEDGTLCLADDCGAYAYCPHDRFRIVLEILETGETYSYVY